jgi:hypothetical protein
LLDFDPGFAPDAGFDAEGFEDLESGVTGFDATGFDDPGFGLTDFNAAGFGTSGFGTSGFGTSGFGTSGFGVAGGVSSGSRSGRSSSKTLRFATLLFVVALLDDAELFVGKTLVVGFASLLTGNGCNRRSSCSIESADGLVAFTSNSAVAAFATSACIPGALSSDNQSSSSFFEGATPGTRIGALHFGQLNFCPASFAGALNFLSH